MSWRWLRGTEAKEGGGRNRHLDLFTLISWSPVPASHSGQTRGEGRGQGAGVIQSIEISQLHTEFKIGVSHGAGGRRRVASVPLWEEKDAFLSFQGPGVLLAGCPQLSALMAGLRSRALTFLGEALRQHWRVAEGVEQQEHFYSANGRLDWCWPTGDQSGKSKRDWLFADLLS